MSLSSNASFTVADAGIESAQVTETVQPPAASAPSGRGRLIHPTLGTFDYLNTPDSHEGVLTLASPRPDRLHSKTIGGGQDTRWTGIVRGQLAIERWNQGDVGAPLTQAGTLWTYLTTLTSEDSGTYVQWYPNYALPAGYNVVLEDLRIGGVSAYKIDSRLGQFGYHPGPVELFIRVVSLIGA